MKTKKVLFFLTALCLAFLPLVYSPNQEQPFRCALHTYVQTDAPCLVIKLYKLEAARQGLNIRHYRITLQGQDSDKWLLRMTSSPFAENESLP